MSSQNTKSPEGPRVERLTRRLAECPPDFLAEPRVGGKGEVHTDAVVHDLILDLGGPPPCSCTTSAVAVNV